MATTFKAAKTREELLASTDQADIDFLELIFQNDTFNDPDEDPFADEVDPDDEDEFYEPEDQSQGDVEGLYDDHPEF